MQGAQFVLAIAEVASAAALSSVLIYFLKPVLVRHLLAHPNERSSHVSATPQGAGVGVMLALLIICAAAWALWPAPEGAMALLPTLAAALGLTVLGLADDARALPVSWRFIGQTLAVLIMVASLPQDLRLFPGLIPLLLALALLGAILGFAVFNKHPAQVFLGDAGSLPIGLLLAFVLIFVAGTNVAAALLLALYTMSDSTITLIRRAANREHIFTAHRSHYYQRAVITGMTPPQVTARIFVLGLVLASLAVTAVILDSTIADILLLGLGAVATGYVLHILA